MTISLAGGKALDLIQGDITREPTDAIVNAANAALEPGGGVCGAIHRAGGPVIAEECTAIRGRHGELATGRAVATSGGRLKAKHVIHTVGPVWEGGARGEPQKLASCYRESIRLADGMGLRSIAFPSISTGIFGYPVELAAPLALNAAREALEEARSVNQVRFVLFDRGTLEAYTKAAEGLAAHARR